MGSGGYDRSTAGPASVAALEPEPREVALHLRLADGSPAVPVPVRSRLRITGGVMAAADFAAAALALLIAIRAGVSLTATAGFFTAVAVVSSSALSGFYGRTTVRLQKTHLSEAAGLTHVGLLVALVLTVVAFEPLSPPQAVVVTCGVVGFVGLSRQALYRLADTRAASERCLLIGSPLRVRDFERQLAASGTSLDIVERIELHRVGGGGGGRVAVEELISRHAADRVIVLADDQVDRAAQAARRARNAGATVTVVPRVAETLGADVVPELVGGMVAFSARPAELSPGQAGLKRAFDVVGAGTALVLAAPLMLAIAALIKLTSRGPVLFCQRRVGRDGRVISMKKFRTMVPGAEALKAGLLDRNEAGDGLFKMVDDPRITRFGRLLRRTSLDELPQLLNVLAGDMSLVGPRPLVPDEDGRIDGWHRDRLRLAPGMTGPWQVMGSARIGLPDMVLLDHHYVSNWSLWGDVQILVRTIGVVLTRRGM